ncbi:MAG: type II toxin-antitoxin system PemK/MazF family toxin [Rhodospirillales bacterium]|nr:type II toxin-antitoxin system PemK/MazF family toxin [Rhodospirillales bacterium]MDH3910451.1 type II toxin-antitoxin system PemK/MazF family toxin [Rhodospirillales bacterium]MDH3916865.1 type II toxin-antitoxin system PemK/MazF family toxin [Rhodospirillales bacterium]MDH3969954.1 type II toxin-antitoxin system PemK/MazF family toxin [Rhodospirillales bacterium]
MKPSATYKRWDVVAVPYPFLEGEEIKRRPALVVSGNELNARHGVYWLAMITTAKAGKQLDDIPLTDHRKAGLPQDCVVRTKRLVTLGDAQISHRLGSITVKDRNAVAGLLRKYLP